MTFPIQFNASGCSKTALPQPIIQQHTQNFHGHRVVQLENEEQLNLQQMDDPVFRALSAPSPLPKVKLVVVTLGNETADEMASIFATLNQESFQRLQYNFEELIDFPEMVVLKHNKEYEFDKPLVLQPAQVELMLSDLQKFLVDERHEGVDMDLLHAIENALS